MANPTQGPTARIHFDPNPFIQNLDNGVDRIDQAVRPSIVAAVQSAANFGVSHGFELAVAKLEHNQAAQTVVRELGQHASACARDSAVPLADAGCNFSVNATKLAGRGSLQATACVVNKAGSSIS